MVEIPTVFEDWSPVQWERQSLTQLEAMMTARPHHEGESLDAKLSLREAIVECFDQLNAEDQFIIDASCFERVTVRELADRLGVCKSVAHRMTQRAIHRLGTICQEHPVVQRALVSR